VRNPFDLTDKVLKYTLFEEMKVMSGGQFLTWKRFQYLLQIQAAIQHEAIDVLGLEELYMKYLFWLKGERLYEIHPNLLRRFSFTHIKEVPTGLLQLPFDCIKLKIPEKYISYINETNERVWVTEFIIMRLIEHLEMIGETKDVIRVFYQAPRTSDVAFFYLFLDEPEIYQCVQKSIEWITKREAEIGRNSQLEEKLNINEIFGFIIKCLLYITGADADVVYQAPDMSLRSRISKVKSTKKKNKLAKRIDKQGNGSYKVGYRIILSREEKEISEKSDSKLWELGCKFMVQGHWRQQAYGPKFSKRKLMFIKPFWKGPEFSEEVNKIHIVK